MEQTTEEILKHKEFTIKRTSNGTPLLIKNNEVVLVIPEQFVDDLISILAKAASYNKLMETDDFMNESTK